MRMPPPRLISEAAWILMYRDMYFFWENLLCCLHYFFLDLLLLLFDITTYLINECTEILTKMSALLVSNGSTKFEICCTVGDIIDYHIFKITNQIGVILTPTIVCGHLIICILNIVQGTLDYIQKLIYPLGRWRKR